MDDVMPEDDSPQEPEALDPELGSSEDDPGEDWALTRVATNAPIEGDSIHRARARVMTTDDAVLNAVEIAQTICNVYGDADEQLSRYAEDLMSVMRLVHLEMNRKPGRVLVRVIRAEKNKDEQLRMIREAMDELQSLLDQFATEAQQGTSIL